MSQMDELNRLMASGLNVTTAMAVADGTRDEAFEIALELEKREVDIWCKGKKNIPEALTAVWDCDPANFYLALDGESPGNYKSSDFVLIEADVADVEGQLTCAATLKLWEAWERHRPDEDVYSNLSDAELTELGIAYDTLTHDFEVE